MIQITKLLEKLTEINKRQDKQANNRYQERNSIRQRVIENYAGICRF